MRQTEHRSSPAAPTSARYDQEAVERLRETVVPVGAKGWPPEAEGLRLADVAARGWRALAGDLPMPALLLRRSALEHNVRLMADLCRERDVLLAPHGKTTMAPQLFARQLDAGAWALTAATPAHLRVYRRFGVRRIFYANQIAEQGVARWIAAELATHPDFELLCLVDSVDGVVLLDHALREAGSPRPGVLVEVGLEGTRAGCRSVDDALEVAAAVARADRLELAGIECFEGLASEPAEAGSAPEAVERLLDLAEGAARALLSRGALGREPWFLSGGGSAWFDRVVERFGASEWRAAGARVVVRSGCYVTHDGGFYERQSPLAGRAPEGNERLRNTIELWSSVLSRPERGLAISSMGKRDAPYDMGLPVAVAIADAGGRRRPAPTCPIVALSDQHAHVAVPDTLELAVGELLGCEVSHPCGAFDRWRLIPVIDDDDVVIDAVVTFF